MVPSPILPSSLGPLWPLTPPLALVPPAPAGNIGGKEEDFWKSDGRGSHEWVVEGWDRASWENPQ